MATVLKGPDRVAAVRKVPSKAEDSAQATGLRKAVTTDRTIIAAEAITATRTAATMVRSALTITARAEDLTETTVEARIIEADSNHSSHRAKKSTTRRRKSSYAVR